MTLIDRSRLLCETAAELKRLREIAEQIQAYRNRAGALEGPASLLSGLAALQAHLHERGVTVNFEVGFGDLRRQAEEIREQFDLEPSSILRPDVALRFAFWGPMRNLPQRVRGQLLQAWGEYVAQILGPQPKSLLDILGRVPTFAIQVEHIRRFYHEADDLAGRLPQGADDFDRVDQLANELQTALRTLTGDGIPDEVIVFLREATTDGASLDRLTTTVLDWLRDNNLASEVLVHVARRR